MCIRDRNNPVLILGAGISGLGAAYKLSCNGQQTVVLEKDTTYEMCIRDRLNDADDVQQYIFPVLFHTLCL